MFSIKYILKLLFFYIKVNTTLNLQKNKYKQKALSYYELILL